MNTTIIYFQEKKEEKKIPFLVRLLCPVPLFYFLYTTSVPNYKTLLKNNGN